MRRLKNSSVWLGSLKAAPPLLATVKAPAFSRKNGRFSGEEQIEPVEVDLLLVDLDLGEVGVDGQIEGDAGRHAVLEVAADVAEHRRLAGARAGMIDHFAHDVGRDLQRAPQPLRRLDAGQLAGQRDPEQVELPRQGRAQ